MNSNSSKNVSLSSADIAVLKTLQLQQKLEAHTATSADLLLVPRQSLAAVRPNPGEALMASGPCTMTIWDAPGDGSYTGVSVPMVATGFANRTGVQFAAGAAVGSLAANMFFKKRARKDAEPRWMPYSSGMMTVSTLGWYIQDQAYGLVSWGWQDVQSIEWLSQSQTELWLYSEQGNIRVQMFSDWAELVFVAWVSATFPDHPRAHAYLTKEWADRVRRALGADPFTGQPIGAVGR